jgi:hypothetical protein
MKLTERQAAAFNDWIHRKVERPTCQVCQSQQWRVGQMITGETDNVLEGGRQPDMVQLICKNCAHVVLFDVDGIEGWHSAWPSHDPSHSAVM